MTSSLDPHRAHQLQIRSLQPELSWEESKDPVAYRADLRECLTSCLGEMPNRVDPILRVVKERQTPEGLQKHIRVQVEEDLEASAVLWLPKESATPPPVMICLQGHTTGAHVSIGDVVYEKDKAAVEGDRDFARQAVRRGYAAFALEQRCFGERSDQRGEELRGNVAREHPLSDERCRHQSMLALLLGRTMVGERVHDVQQSLDLLESLPEVDSSRIYCMGNSGGGTITFYSACLDDRIAGVMVSCSYCTYEHSICRHDHCSDNYIPGVLRHFDMPDLTALIVPRPFVAVSGVQDPLFPPEGVDPAVEKAGKMYASSGAEGAFAHVAGPGGHRFYADSAWKAFDQCLISDPSRVTRG
jgi:dienelactone hydrolase